MHDGPDERERVRDFGPNEMIIGYQGFAIHGHYINIGFMTSDVSELRLANPNIVNSEEALFVTENSDGTLSIKEYKNASLS